MDAVHRCRKKNFGNVMSRRRTNLPVDAISLWIEISKFSSHPIYFSYSSIVGAVKKMYFIFSLWILDCKYFTYIATHFWCTVFKNKIFYYSYRAVIIYSQIDQLNEFADRKLNIKSIEKLYIRSKSVTIYSI